MSYTPPTGNAIDFSWVGTVEYTPPINPASVNFEWTPEIPTVVMVCKSTMTFHAGFMYALSSGSIVTPETPFRAFGIQSSSAPFFNTDQRHLLLDLSSNMQYRAGMPFSVTASSSADIKAIGAVVTNYAEVQGTAPALFYAAWVVDSTCSIQTKTRLSIAGGKIAPLTFRSNAKSVFAGKTNPIVSQSFTAAGQSVLNGRGTAVRAVVGSVSTNSLPYFYGNKIVSSEASYVSSAVAEFYGMTSRRSAYTEAGLSLVSFASSYMTAPVLLAPKDADTVFVLSLRKQIIATA